MLVQFSVGNFLSFKESATISMVAAKRRSQDKTLDVEAVFTPPASVLGNNEPIQLLKTAAIYGANGSGKSNLIHALKFFKNFVVQSSKESQAGEQIDVSPFAFCTSTNDQPSSFEVVFIKAKSVYQYTFTADRTEIRSEKLIRRGPRSKRDITLFARENGHINIAREFPEGEGLTRKTRSNSLFLSVCANFDGPISIEILDWFRSVRIISAQLDLGYMSFTSKKLRDPNWNEKILGLISKFDLGIERLVPKSIEAPSGADKDLQKLQETFSPTIASYHNRYDSDGQLVDQVALDFMDDESQGTQKLVGLAGPFIDTLENSYILVIDEFDSKLHPMLSRKIVQLFNSSANFNNAQLIVATHDSNLLDRTLFRRDQIWFVEKDFFGASQLTSLVEYKVRNDASFESDYISGKYGAVPILGDIQKHFLRNRRSSKASREAA